MTLSKKAKNRGLGKGLEELFGNVEIDRVGERTEEKSADNTQLEVNKEDDKNRILFLDINDISPNVNQPRKTFSEEKINELAESIEKHGVIQPIVIKELEKGYEIIAGERRWRAARKANLKKVPCVLKELTEEENMVIAIIENMQREDLNAIEEAEALGEMIEKFGLSQEQVSKTVGKSRPYITNALRLLKLPIEIRMYVIESRLSAGHARAILGLKDEIKQIELADRAVDEDLSVREVEQIVKLSGEEKRTKNKKNKEKNPNILSLEEDLSEKLGTKVVLKENRGKGKLEISFYNREELDGLIELLMNVK